MSGPQDAVVSGPQDVTVVVEGRRRRLRGRSGCLVAAAVLGGLAFVAGILTLIVTAIWPGEAKLTAPLFCPDDTPDAFVVVDSHSDGTGETSYNFTLYCMGSRGEVVSQGWSGPFFLLMAAHAALIVVVPLGLLLLLRARRRRHFVPGQQFP